MKFLVTGGSGYIGTHVRRYFGADDLSRSSGFDVLNTADAAIAADYDVVIHLAAHLDKAPDAAEQVFLTNVEGTVNLLKNCRRDTVFIFASTKDVYGRASRIISRMFRKAVRHCTRGRRHSNGRS